MTEIPSILQEAQFDQAVALVRRYYGLESGSTRHIGASFETVGLASAADDAPDEVTAADLVALATLSVEVSGAAVVDLLESDRSVRVSELLAQIPAEIQLIDAGAAALIADDGAASKLWFEIRKVPGFGPTRTSKLLARKRPLLLPIYDSIIREELGLASSIGHWDLMRDLVTRDENALWHRAERVRDAAGVPEGLSPLRILDIILWRQGKDAGRSAAED